MGLWESALILLGIGIVSSRFKAGVGLGELGVGIKTLAGAPLGGLGLGLGEFGTGLRTFAESLGDIGRGFGELFKHIPPLIPDAGGSETDNYTGGGGNVPTDPWTQKVLAESWVASSPPGPGMELLYVWRKENGYRFAPKELFNV